MADRDPKTGLFLKGNQAPKKQKLPRKLLNLLREDRVAFIEFFVALGRMNTQDFDKADKTKMNKTQEAVYEIWDWIVKNPNAQSISILFSMMGMKSDTIKEYIDDDTVDENESAQNDKPPLPMTKAERKAMLKKWEAAIDREDGE